MTEKAAQRGWERFATEVVQNRPDAVKSHVSGPRFYDSVIISRKEKEFS